MNASIKYAAKLIGKIEAANKKIAENKKAIAQINAGRGQSCRVSKL